MKRLGSILEEAGLIDEIQLVRALSHQRKWHCRLGKSLVDLGFVDEDSIAKAISGQLDVPYHELDPKATPANLLEIFPKKIALEKYVFPVRFGPSNAGKVIVLAMSDPSDKDTMLELEKSTGYRMDPVATKDSAIEDAVSQWDRYLSSNPRSSPQDQIASAHQGVEQTLSPSPEELLDDEVIEDAEVMEDLTQISESAPVAAPEVTSTPQPQPETEFDRGVPPPAPPTPLAGHENISSESAPGSSDDKIAQMPDPDELLSASDMPPIEGIEQIEDTPKIEEADPLAQTKPAVTQPPVEPQSVSEEQAPEIIQSQPWEHIMPGVDAAADVEPPPIIDAPEAIETDAPEIIQSQPWEHIMPGVDAAAANEPAQTANESNEGVAIDVDGTDVPEITQSQPWEHIMPGVDAAKEVETAQQEVATVEKFTMDTSPMEPVETETEDQVPPPPPAGPEEQPTDQATDQAREMTCEQLHAQVVDLTTQVSLLKQQMSALREVVAKLKKNESD